MHIVEDETWVLLINAPDSENGEVQPFQFGFPPENSRLILPESAFEELNTTLDSEPDNVIQPLVFRLFDSKSSLNPTKLQDG